MSPPRVGSLRKITFSAIVSEGKSLKDWKTMPMPASIASSGEEKRCFSPRMKISPSSGWYTPARIDIRIDLPAPFSPIRA